jgi:thioredoxin 2
MGFPFQRSAAGSGWRPGRQLCHFTAASVSALAGWQRAAQSGNIGAIDYCRSPHVNTPAITNISCPDCFTTNRIPTQRLGDKPKCGKCKQPLFQGKPVDLDADNVSAMLANTDVPVLVDCWAPWCGPCQGFAPIFTQAARELEPRLRFAKLNTEDEQQLAGLWAIRSIPTLILFREGREVARSSGALPLPHLKKWLLEQGV